MSPSLHPLRRPHLGSLVIAMSLAALLLAHASVLEAATVRFNEIMASNQTTLLDNDGDASDWIELLNPDPDALVLAGYGVSDDSADPFKWVLPDMQLPGGSFLVLFASGKDRAVWPGELHTNFRIDAEGEELCLTAPDDHRVDYVSTVAMNPDVSYGRIPDGGAEWWLLDTPTPGGSNGLLSPPPRLPLPQFSPQSGFYPFGTSVELACSAEGATIHYTTDGAVPTATSPTYIEPIRLTRTAVLRAVGLSVGYRSSHTASASYIVDYDTSLPVVSIATDPGNLWSADSGIYVEGPNADPEEPHDGANYWQDWEIPVHVDFFEPHGVLGASFEAGAKVHGGWSRMYGQKSLRITARSEYGATRLDYPFFPDLSIFCYKSVILRNSGNDWQSTMIRGALMSDLVRLAGLGAQAYRPSVLFLNGDYWGIHNMRERMDEDYLAAHYGADSDSVDLIENHRIANAGDLRAYISLVQFVEDHDMCTNSAYDSLCVLMDVENFARYQATEIYYANLDWPNNNNLCWRDRAADGRFRWLLDDTDQGFGLNGSYDHNTLAYATVENSDSYANSPGSTLLLRKLLENASFKEMFIARFCDLLSIVFPAERVGEAIDSLQAAIHDEMIFHRARWYPQHDWDSACDGLRTFAQFRIGHVLNHLRDRFGPGEPLTVTIDVPGDPAGRVWVNGFVLSATNWEGHYFPGLPIELTAEPLTGYRFARWEGDAAGGEPQITVWPEGNATIRAVFEPSGGARPAVVISEINYHSAPKSDPGDWVELYACSGTHPLGDWTLRDECDDHCFVLPVGAVLAEGSYLILASNKSTFADHFPNVPMVGSLGFDLSNGGDQVRLFDASGSMVDSVAFDDEFPWPLEADGTGATLQLIHPAYRNELPHNWRASTRLGGNPGEGPFLSAPTTVPAPTPQVLVIEGVHPNPFSNLVTVSFSLPEPGYPTVRLYAINGRAVQAPLHAYLERGRHRLKLDANHLPEGAYVLRVSLAGYGHQSRCVILLGE